MISIDKITADVHIQRRMEMANEEKQNLENSEECTHDCSTCGANCSSKSGEPQDLSAHLNPQARVDKVYAVVSGKGGVGKSFVTCLLATKCRQAGKSVAILDADITGPSIPKAFGVDAKPGVSNDNLMLPPVTSTSIQMMSTNLLLNSATDPVVWRGPMIASVVTQFWTDTMWDADYMFVDMPPGTGDVPLTVFQSLPVDGIIIVTSPQDLVGMIVEKAVNMANMMNIPIVGIVENMSGFKCPDCGNVHDIFGKSHVDEVAAKYNLSVLAKIPLDPLTAKAMDDGLIEYAKLPDVDTSKLF